MTEILDAIQKATSLLRFVAGVDRALLSDADLVRLLSDEEAAGRLVDAARVRTAAEVDDRSRFELGAGGLSIRNGFRKVAPFISQIARVSDAEVGRRLRLGRAIRAGLGLSGELIPPAHPAVALALTSGSIGVEAAGAIVTNLRLASVGSEATPERMDAAECALVEFATSEDPDLVSVAAREWRHALDPDGAEPAYDEILQRRGLLRGREHNGITDFRIKADPLTTALLDAALADSTAPGAGPRFLSETDAPGGTTTVVDDDGDEIEVLVDRRTREQKQLDIFVGVFTAGVRATHDGPVSMRTTGAVTATITLQELESGVGLGWLNGIREPIPASVLQQMVCDAGVRVMVLGSASVPLFEAVVDRYFNQAHRRAMVVRDGDRCLGPGCDAPAAWCEGHHVIFHRDRGPTNIDNGVLLCRSCHSALHSGAFELRVIDGVPHRRLGLDSWDESAWRRVGRPRGRRAETAA